MPDKNAVRLDLIGGMDTRSTPDQTAAWPYLQNVRRNLDKRAISRPPLGNDLLSAAVASPVSSLTRLNDPYQSSPGYVYIFGAAGGMYVDSTAVQTEVASGLSGQPLSFLPYRPPASPQPWCYVADPSLAVSILNPSYAAYGNVCGMLKVRSDGTCYKMGVKEPQVAPAITVGTGTGPNWVTYRYVYRSSITGATSNPSPESPPQITPQTSASGTLAATSPNITFNAAQYAVSGSQLRTAGGVSPGTLTDYVIAKNFGLAIPAGVTIDGVQIALSWVGQYAGTGILANVAMFYQGQVLGAVKSPGTQNSQTTTTATEGGGSDSWGAILTPAIMNDTTFGFGVQILTAESGGSDRSFLNQFTITVYYTTLSSTGTCTASTDPQVDTIDVYRQTPGLDNFTYVLSVPNSAPSFTDTQADLVIAQNPILSFENYEPFPSIDLPRAGVCNSDGAGNITWVSGDTFNVRWLPGTIIKIDGVAYVLYNRPSSTTALKAYTTVTATSGYISFGYPPAGTNLSYQISEPTLAAQPSPVIWGPTPDNAGSFFFGLDPLNPGDLLWSLGNNFDSAPDTNRMYVTSPSEPLQNGTVTSELSTVFSNDRFWLIIPNFSDAVAAVTGTLGQQWTLIQSKATRGLYMRYALAALGSMIAFRAKDGIFVSMGGGPEQSITDGIYNLFPHGGQTPSPVTIAGYTVNPPDDTKPNAQTLTAVPGYIFYDYEDVSGTPRTLVYDMEAKGWSVDVYTPAVNCHAWAVGAVNQILCGATDGTVRTMVTGGTEAGTSVIVTRSDNAGNSRIVKRIGGYFLRAVAGVAITLAYYAQRFQTAITGFAPASVTGASGVEQDFLINFTAAANADVLDFGAAITWPLGSGNILSEYQPDWTTLPEQIIGYKTGLLSYGGTGWMSIPWVNLCYASTATVTLTLTLAGNSGDTLATIPLTFPATSGAQIKQFINLPANKFKLAGWTLSSASPFTVYAEDCEMALYKWGEQAVMTRPFSGFGTPGASS